MVTAEKTRANSTPCPRCGGQFRNLGAHSRHCKVAPAAQPLPPMNTPSAEAVLLAQYENKTETTKQDLYGMLGQNPDEKDRGSVTHTTAGKVTLYKPATNAKGTILYWRRTEIMASNLGQAIKDGFRETCGDCGGYCGNEPNDCPGRTPKRYRVCPICASKIFDAVEDAPTLDEATAADPMAIQDTHYSTTTPEQRTLSKLETHIGSWHPQEGMAYGIKPVVDNRVGRIGENLPR